MERVLQVLRIRDPERLATSVRGHSIGGSRHRKDEKHMVQLYSGVRPPEQCYLRAKLRMGLTTIGRK